MRRFPARNAAAAAVALLFSAGCGGGGVPNVSGANGVATANRSAHPARVSGEYSGSFTDSVYGKGTATAVYAQEGDAVGGAQTIAYGSQTRTESVSQVVSGNSGSGTAVDDSGSTYCSFATASTYDAGKRRLKGTFTAVYGCSGEHGTFTLHQQCYFKGQGSGNDIRPDGGPHPC